MKKFNIRKLEKIEKIQKNLFDINKKNFSHEFKNLNKIMRKNFQIFLNNYHNKNFSNKQWSVLLGPWLDHIIQIYIINSTILKKKKKNYKNILNLDFNKPEKFLVCKDFDEFVKQIYSNKFNQLFLKELYKRNNFFFYRAVNIKSKLSFRSTFYNLIIYFYKFLPSRVLISRFRSKNFTKLRIFLKSFFKIYFFPSLDSLVEFDESAKKKRTLNLNSLKFKKKKIFLQLLKFIPSSYLENFKEYENFSKKYYKEFEIVISDSTYLNDELLKLNIISNFNVKKIKIFIEQHGGNFELFENVFSNYHEKKISDKYISWSIKKNKNTLNPPSSRIFFFVNSKNNFKKFDNFHFNFCIILPSLKKLFFFPHLRENFKNELYFDKFVNFLKKNNLYSQVVFKAYVESRYSNQLSTNDISHIYKIQKNKIFESGKIIASSKILVFNYISTMIFEALVSNKPFIIVFPKEHSRLSQYGIKIFNELQKMRIFFKTFQETKTIFENPEGYYNEWFSIKKQKKINLIRNNILKNKTSPSDFVDQWVKFINRNFIK